VAVTARRGVVGSRDDDASEVGGASEMTSLAEELGMAGREEESCEGRGRSLLPAHDSAEVDSLPEDRGKLAGPLPTVHCQFHSVVLLLLLLRAFI